MSQLTSAPPQQGGIQKFAAEPPAQQVTVDIASARKTAEQQELAVAVAAQAAREEMIIKAIFTKALARPRVWRDVKAELIEFCKDPDFADGARWSRIVGSHFDDQTQEWVDDWGDGFSIRFAEAALTVMGNCYVASTVVSETAETRGLQTLVMDCQANNAWCVPDMISKTMERSRPKADQAVISERTNSRGKKVYKVMADDITLRQHTNAALSRTQRTMILRLLPQYIKDACETQIRETMTNLNLEESTKKITGAFGRIGVTEKQLEEYLGHPIKNISDNEVVNLRGLHTTLRDGQGTWADLMQARREVPIETSAEEEPTPGAETVSGGKPMTEEGSDTWGWGNYARWRNTEAQRDLAREAAAQAEAERKREEQQRGLNIKPRR